MLIVISMKLSFSLVVKFNQIELKHYSRFKKIEQAFEQSINLFLETRVLFPEPGVNRWARKRQ
jgi:hypothetical protein